MINIKTKSKKKNSKENDLLIKKYKAKEIGDNKKEKNKKKKPANSICVTPLNFGVKINKIYKHKKSDSGFRKDHKTNKAKLTDNIQNQIEKFLKTNSSLVKFRMLK